MVSPLITLRDEILYGFDNEREMVGMKAIDPVAPEDRRRAMDNGNRVPEELAIHEIEHNAPRKDGERLPIRLAATGLRPSWREPE
jgi:hypothetical protein